jgi:hypothetical protein
MGIYGTVSYIVVLRTREVRIRAIRAQKRNVLGLILGESARCRINCRSPAGNRSVIFRARTAVRPDRRRWDFVSRSLIHVPDHRTAGILPSRREPRVSILWSHFGTNDAGTQPGSRVRVLEAHLSYPVPTLDPLVALGGRKLLSISEIGATKAFNIGRTFKDYVVTHTSPGLCAPRGS